MTVPLQRVKPDESGDHRFVEVRVLDRVRVRVTVEHLTQQAPAVADGPARRNRAVDRA